MLITYFKDSRTLARYRSGLANLYLENFIVWLESQGYQRFTIRRHVREVVHFADWAEAEGLALRDLNRGALNRLCSQLAERNSLRYPCGKQRHICHSAFLLIDFLEEIGAVEARPPYTSTQDPTLLLEFREWMRAQRGTFGNPMSPAFCFGASELHRRSCRLPEGGINSDSGKLTAPMETIRRCSSLSDRGDKERS